MEHHAQYHCSRCGLIYDVEKATGAESVRAFSVLTAESEKNRCE
jgi:transcription elongation factor Elf1